MRGTRQTHVGVSIASGHDLHKWSLHVQMQSILRKLGSAIAFLPFKELDWLSLAELARVASLVHFSTKWKVLLGLSV